MTRHRLFTLCILSLSFQFTLAQLDFDWGLSIGNKGRDETTGISLDPLGNLYMTGTFEDSVDVIDGAGVEYVKGNGWRDILVAKYSPAGDKLWAFALGDLGWDRGWALTTDDQGAVYVGGVFSGTVDFDPSAGTTAFTANPAGVWPDGYLAKYDTDGNLLWAKHLLTARDRAASQTATLLAIHSMEIDGNGDLVIGGAFWDTVYLSPSKMIVSQTSLRDMFLAKYDTDGNLLWGQQMGGGGDQQIQALTTDEQDNIFTTGYFFGTPDFDPAGGGSTLTSAGLEDMFLAKYTSTGSLDWVKGIGSINGSNTSSEMGMDVGTDAMGNVYFTGRLLGPADFDPSSAMGDIVLFSSAASFVAKYDSQGGFDWVFSFEGNGTHVGKQLSVFPSGDFYLAGEYAAFGAGIDLDPSVDSMRITSLGGSVDIFVAKYDANRAFQTGWTVRGLGGGEVNGLAANGKEVAIGGLYNSSMLFHQQSGDLRFSKGDFDMFALRYSEASNGLPDNFTEGSLQLFPNPTHGPFTIKATWPHPQDAVVTLRNLQGQVLQTWQTKASKDFTLKVDKKALASGFYLVELVLAEGRMMEKLVVR